MNVDLMIGGGTRGRPIPEVISGSFGTKSHDIACFDWDMKPI